MGFETLCRRPVDPAGDAALLHGWVQEDRAEFWGMQEHTLEDVRDTYAWIDEQPHLTADLVELDGEALALVQTYDPAVDEIGKHYDRRPGDLGIHLFMRPGARPSGSLEALLGFFLGQVFGDAGVQRLVLEPDVRNEKSIALVHRFADELGPVVELPHPVPGVPPKTAQFAFVHRPEGL
ncbi:MULTISPECIES: GNAT family N-acetyltransferase [unclassified Knoellia]|uniref:GNAT family N-acetyltransferase n=1 Tax=Knoellia altitudinis TaxID=3404795 RepID=UPI0036198758